ncbi:AIPR family protein [Azospirillum sp. HJ39]|uniref:AIPR family protein n=1 Tax=Azospirillum sp. HJ39 TaxID=3159496 RepID=UPI003558B6CC
MPTVAQSASDPWLSAFRERSDLEVYGDNAIGLFALALKFGLDDLETVAAESITDGHDDKKCDLLHISKEDGVAVIAQCYYSTKVKQSAPANKASDLNTAVAWLLQRELKDLPDRISVAAQDLREAISGGEVTQLYIWYIHNLPESENVRNELRSVEATAIAALKHHHPDDNVRVQVLEVGAGQFNEWYNDTQSPILVNEDFSLQVSDGFEIAGPEWKAYVTAIPLAFLRAEFKKYNVKLFSANVRDYLGSKESDNNINHGIKKTAESEPQNFWAYNNGLTILVHSFEPPSPTAKRRVFQFKGMSIVNGAQTTGAIASTGGRLDAAAKVAARFVQTSDQQLLYSIIRYNNSQNKVTASDFRSTDATQRRLREEIKQIPSAEYEGGRRGGLADAIRRRSNLLPSYTVGQALAALHGDPVVAYNQRADIWAVDRLYARYFTESVTGSHIVFAYSLLKAVESTKMALVTRAKKEPDTLTEDDNQQLSFFRKRGSTYLMVAALAACLETFLDKKISNLARVSFGSKIAPKRAQQIWMELIEVNMPLCIYLEEAFTYGLKSPEKAKGAILKFRSLVQATKKSNSATYRKFSNHIVII